MRGTDSDPQARLAPIASQQEVVERAESYLRAHLATPVPISRLCRIVGRSERGLRNAFYNVYGMSPKQYVLVTRLHSVRRALRNPSASPTTVTGIATSHGFYELGRFAAIYKREFGEAPSQTLRATAGKSGGRLNTDH